MATTTVDGTATTTTSALTILNGGNVGIGTTNPNYKLEVNGTSGFTGNMVMTADNTYDLGASSATRPRTGYLPNIPCATFTNPSAFRITS